MYRRDRDRFRGELMFYANEQIPCKVLSLESISMDIKLILLDFTFKNQRWLCVGKHRLPSQNRKYFIYYLPKTLGQLTCLYDKTMLIGDSNLTTDNNSLENLMSTLDLECLIKKANCFESSNPTCIDLTLTDKKELFKNTDVIEVGISDHHSLIVTASKSQLLFFCINILHDTNLYKIS